MSGLFCVRRRGTPIPSKRTLTGLLYHKFRHKSIIKRPKIAGKEIQCTMHNAQFTMHNAQCTMHNYLPLRAWGSPGVLRTIIAFNSQLSPFERGAIFFCLYFPATISWQNTKNEDARRRPQRTVIKRSQDTKAALLHCTTKITHWQLNS